MWVGARRGMGYAEALPAFSPPHPFWSDAEPASFRLQEAVVQTLCLAQGHLPQQ